MNEIEIDASTWRRCGGGRLNQTCFTTTTGAREQLCSFLLPGLHGTQSIGRYAALRFYQ